MSDLVREAMERERARLLEEAAAKKAAAEAIDRDLAELGRLAAELGRLAAKYNLTQEAIAALHAATTEVPSKPQSTQGSDTSVASLIDRYKSHKESNYLKLRYRTRLNYDSLIRRILDDCQEQKLGDLKAQDIQRLYGRWTERGSTMGRSLITMLRLLFGFGATILEDRECERLSAVLHHMRFPMGTPRKERLTAEQANAIRAEAHRRGLHSIALAQAFQFECPLRQKDVIGEWIPVGEPLPSDVLDDRGSKWTFGIQWSEIDKSNLMLRHLPSNRGKELVIDLKNAPMVMDEFARLDELRDDGPIIVCETTGRPWRAVAFRSLWRDIADACDVPKGVFNMDSRSAANNEATSRASNGHYSPKHREESEKERATGHIIPVARH